MVFKQILTLDPHDAENALRVEARVLRNLFIDYVHIPVDSLKPNELDFSIFLTVRENHRAEKVWIRCAANMRVSAFLFR